jgi:hypothetical protein
MMKRIISALMAIVYTHENTKHDHSSRHHLQSDAPDVLVQAKCESTPDDVFTPRSRAARGGIRLRNSGAFLGISAKNRNRGRLSEKALLVALRAAPDGASNTVERLHNAHYKGVGIMSTSLHQNGCGPPRKLYHSPTTDGTTRSRANCVSTFAVCVSSCMNT